jgi:hypothetical protein
MNFAQTTVVVTSDNAGALSGFAALWFIWLLYVVILIIGIWKMFEKAGEPGWKSIVPVYNTYTLLRISGRNGWWFLGLFIPLVNLFVLIRLALDLAKHYGKSTVFAVFGLMIFTAIGYLMLGFGDAKYVGTKHA